MAWFKVDDKLHSHPKRFRAGLEAMGLWTLCGSWTSDQLTDGFIPEYIAEQMGGRNWRRLAGRLVTAGLWVEAFDDGEPGWRFHQFLDRNPSRNDVEEQRAKNAQKIADWRAKKREEKAQ